MNSLAVRTVRVTLLGLIAFGMAIPLLPIAQAQTQQDFWNATERKFYLHLAQYCDRNEALIRWIDEFDWTNDLDGCGGHIAEPASTWTDVFPAFLPFYANVTTGTTAEMHIFVLSRAVDQTSVEATYDLGYAKCSGSAAPEVLVQSRVGNFHEFIIPCTFEVSGPADPMARANLTLTVTATHTYGYGVEGDHASYVTLSGVQPAPPKEQTQVFSEAERPLVQFDEEKVVLADLPAATEAKGKAPSFDVAVTFVALAGLVLGLGRLRRRT